MLKTALKITEKKFIFEKNYWKITAAHDGYLKKYNSIHKRDIQFYPEQMIFIGNDRIPLFHNFLEGIRISFLNV